MKGRRNIRACETSENNDGRTELMLISPRKTPNAISHSFGENAPGCFGKSGQSGKERAAQTLLKWDTESKVYPVH